ncbi:MAG: hypothetical protein WD431_22320 [Cyclobacteriaceae bacterium]
MKSCNIFLFYAFFMLPILKIPAQEDRKEGRENKNKELKISLNEDGSHYVKGTFLNQIWVRNTQNNPGTTVDGYGEDNTFDIGLRRTRIQLFGQLSDKVFFYTQFGTNNLSYIGDRKQGLFFHDALAEIEIWDKFMAVGTGITGWNGLSRYASPSVGSVLSLDAPLYQQATNDATDQFLRKYSVYAKGKIGGMDYRLAMSKPMTIANSTVQGTSPGQNALFSAEPPHLQYHGYLMYQFLDSESNLTPYNVGSYQGKMTVFNLGAGFIYQNDAMWHLNDNAELIHENLSLLSVDAFLDHPISKERGTAITAYAAFSSNSYGKNYVRNLGVMNPTNGVNTQGSFNGPGNAFPMMGTGTTSYFQLGYLFNENLLANMGTLQPFITTQYSKFDLLDEAMMMNEYGFNWLIDRNNSKLSFQYQSRPVFNTNGLGDLIRTDRKGMWVMQFQISI